MSLDNRKNKILVCFSSKFGSEVENFRQIMVHVCSVLSLQSGPTTRTALSALLRALASGSQPRAKSAATTTGFPLCSTKAPTWETVDGMSRWRVVVAGACLETSRLWTTRLSYPAKCPFLVSWRSLAVTSARGPTTRVCWLPLSPVQRSWWSRPWKGKRFSLGPKTCCWVLAIRFIPKRNKVKVK